MSNSKYAYWVGKAQAQAIDTFMGALVVAHGLHDSSGGVVLLSPCWLEIYDDLRDVRQVCAHPPPPPPSLISRAHPPPPCTTTTALIPRAHPPPLVVAQFADVDEEDWDIGGGCLHYSRQAWADAPVGACVTICKELLGTIEVGLLQKAGPLVANGVAKPPGPTLLDGGCYWCAAAAGSANC
jgi:hypothetical protein